jgi:predicted alpha/beta superfamily hydrolase
MGVEPIDTQSASSAAAAYAGSCGGGCGGLRPWALRICSAMARVRWRAEAIGCGEVSERLRCVDPECSGRRRRRRRLLQQAHLPSDFKQRLWMPADVLSLVRDKMAALRRAALLLAAALLSACATCVAGDGVLVVSVVYPDENLSNGATLTLRGAGLDALSWARGLPLQHTAPNEWRAWLPLPRDGANATLVQVKALVDDAVWQAGANAQLQLPEGASGELLWAVYPFFFSKQGSYEYVRSVFSPQFNNTRDLVVYLPPSYYENPLRPEYPVLVMHDGQNLFNSSTSFGGVAWQCQDTVDGLVMDGAMQELVIVGIDNTPDRIYEYTYSYDATVGDGGGGDFYLDFIEQTVLPLAASLYRLSGDRHWRGMAGSSLGGLISCYAGWTRPQLYGRVACMSSSFFWNNEDFNNTVLSNWSTPNDTAMYLDSGDKGEGNDDEAQTVTVRNTLEQVKGFVMNQSLFYYLDHGGEHNEAYWGARFWIPMTDLYPPRVDAPVATSRDRSAAPESQRSQREAGTRRVALPNLRPIIGILTQPWNDPDNGTSYLVADYVKWVESAGARAAVVPFNASAAELEFLFQGLNGLIYTGGGQSLAFDTPYFQTSYWFFQRALQSAAEGDPFPLWGTCQGFQLLSIMSAYNLSVLEGGFDSENLPLSLDFAVARDQSRIFSSLPPQVYDILASENVTMNLHQFGVTPATYASNPKLSTFWTVVSTNADRKGRAFVSTVEAADAAIPFFAVQWHPERNQFEWDLQEALNHSPDAMFVMQNMATFLVSQARLSAHAFATPQLEQSVLIYNYRPTFTGDWDENYPEQQTYFFPQ